MLGTFISSCLQVSTISYFALFVQARFGKENYNPVLIGVTFSGCALGTIFASPFYTVVSSAIGRKNAMIFGSVIMLCMNTACGCLGYMGREHVNSFLALTFMCRLVLGYADGQVITTINSIICTSEKRDMYLGLANASRGLGSIAGPVIGAIVYA